MEKEVESWRDSVITQGQHVIRDLTGILSEAE